MQRVEKSINFQIKKAATWQHDEAKQTTIRTSIRVHQMWEHEEEEMNGKCGGFAWLQTGSAITVKATHNMEVFRVVENASRRTHQVWYKKSGGSAEHMRWPASFGPSGMDSSLGFLFGRNVHPFLARALHFEIWAPGNGTLFLVEASFWRPNNTELWTCENHEKHPMELSEMHVVDAWLYEDLLFFT